VRVKAPVVVLHLGCIDMKDYTGKLEKVLTADGKDSRKFEKLRDETLKVREAKKEKFFARMKETLGIIVPEAEKRGLKLGCENRQAMEELPLEGDFEDFLKEFASPSIVYWHDTGHAQIKENFGVVPHAKFLETLAPRLAGFHVHDVVFPADDHAAPGKGTIDFAALKPFVKPEHIKVFEFSPALPATMAKAGVAHVKAIWGEE
jgi:sugar phosphate isomerase/epimerase